MNYKNNFKNISYEILDALKKININPPKIKCKNIENFYNFILNNYLSIETNNIYINDYKKSKINFNTSTSFCNFYNYLKYLHKQNLLTDANLNNILKENNFDECCIYINNYGKNLVNSIFNDIQNDNIPKQFLDKFNIIDKDLYGHFTSLKIQENMEQLIKYKHSYYITYKGLNINLKIFSNAKTINKKKLFYLIKRIILMHNLSIDKNDIDITLILTNLKKEINNNFEKILGPNEINSGFTSFYNPKVVIFREEEVAKLIIHELIHYFRIDFHHFEYEEIYDKVNINKSNKININESYTEILACLINAIICSYDIYKKKNVDYFCNLLFYELKYNLYNVAKILNYYQFNNVKEFFSNSNNTNTKFKQNTSVFSYFIIKTSLLFSMIDFLKFLDNNNNYLEKNNNSQNEYIKLINKTLTNNKFHNILQQFLNYITKNKTLDTLRMTMFEINI